jgi:hypothetical protein
MHKWHFFSVNIHTHVCSLVRFCKQCAEACKPGEYITQPCNNQMNSDLQCEKVWATCTHSWGYASFYVLQITHFKYVQIFALMHVTTRTCHNFGAYFRKSTHGLHLCCWHVCVGERDFIKTHNSHSYLQRHGAFRSRVLRCTLNVSFCCSHRCLVFDKQNAAAKSCFPALIDPLHIKKHPHIIGYYLGSLHTRIPMGFCAWYWTFWALCSVHLVANRASISTAIVTEPRTATMWSAQHAGRPADPVSGSSPAMSRMIIHGVASIL